MPKHVVKLILNKLTVVWIESTVICGLLRYDAAHSGNSVPTIRNNLSVPSSTVRSPKRNGFLNPTSRYDITTPRCLISQKSADLIYIAAEV
jgi:hypothetical protein